MKFFDCRKISLHQDIDSSKGTNDMVAKARKSGVPVVAFK